MAVNNTNWTAEATILGASWILPSNTTYSDNTITYSSLVIPYIGADVGAPTAFTETGIPVVANWSRNSGIDTSVPTYDSIIETYDESTEYYDGYNANIITEDDVKFSTFIDAGTPVSSAWTDET